MERRFNLIKSDFEKHEKRVLPRFPFCYLTFKSDENSRVYEVKDISHTGMQLSLKDGTHEFEEDGVMKGHIHWLGKNLDIAGTIKWHTANRIGVEFVKKRDVLEKVQNFLQIDELVKRMMMAWKSQPALSIGFALMGLWKFSCGNMLTEKLPRCRCFSLRLLLNGKME
jgi:hypothetical protein